VPFLVFAFFDKILGYHNLGFDQALIGSWLGIKWSWKSSFHKEKHFLKTNAIALIAVETLLCRGSAQEI